MIIKEIGKYRVIEVTKTFVCLDYYVGKPYDIITLQVFEDIPSAMKIFNKIIKETGGEKKVHYDTFIRRIEDFEQVK